MVTAVRNGEKMRSVARRVGRSLSTVQLWVERAKDKELACVDWSDLSSAPHSQPNRTDSGMEAIIMKPVFIFVSIVIWANMERKQ
jgi:hypothetical protein